MQSIAEQLKEASGIVGDPSRLGDAPMPVLLEMR